LRSLAILLILLTVVSATAPSWIDTGVSVNYTAGGNSVSFTVTGRAGDDITILLATSPPPHTGTIKGNASSDSGQFWFDQSLLNHAYSGQDIDGLSVMGTSQQTIAGQTWDTVTLQGDISGAQTTQIYDTETGMLLKQSVDKEGVPDVVLSKFYIPSLAPPPPVTPKQNTTTPPPPKQNASAPVTPSPNATTNSSGTPPVSDSTGQTQPQQGNPPATQGSTTTPINFENPSPTECCPGTFILLLLGFVAIKGSRR